MTTICRAVRIISVARQNTGGSVAEPISRVEYTDEFIIESEQLCTTANRDTMLPDRYNIRNLRRVLTNPAHLINELRCLSQSIVIRLNNAVFKLKHGSGIDIFDEDWDNLIILDACRYDYFAQEYELGGDLHQSISGGSHSWAFMQHNFVGQTLHDTVYVTGNPHVEKLDDSTFFAVRNVLSEWDEELQTVVPQAISEATKLQHRTHPDKRLIAHFMQPHVPHLGPTAEELRERVKLCGWDKNIGHEGKRTPLSGISIWDAVKEGYVTQSEVETAYRETLSIVMEFVEDLVESVNGKTVITADHGEMLGEKTLPMVPPQYGHPHHIQTNELRKVPWLVIDSDERRDIVEGEPVGHEHLDEDIIDERLEALGYVD